MSVGKGWLDEQAGPVQGERAGGLVGVAGMPGKQLRSRLPCKAEGWSGWTNSGGTWLTAWGAMGSSWSWRARSPI